MKYVVLYGASGSIGGNALEITRRYRDRFTLSGLSVHGNTSDLTSWIEEFEIERVWISQSEARDLWRRDNTPLAERVLVDQPEELLVTGTDLVLNGVMGFAGLSLTLAALERDLDVALANKESLVCGGEFLLGLARRSKGRLLPVDSEHNALFQLLEGRPREQIKRLWITASGGPFKDTPPEELPAVSPAQALRHPTWRMGPKITVDSATLMNKGLEVIEASLLFDFPSDRIGVLVHPTSTVHALIELVDGGVICQMASPDMKQPILHALTWPDRFESEYGRLDFTRGWSLDFSPLDSDKFPAVKIAREALQKGGTATLALNAADEVAVAAFLAGDLPFTEIAQVVAGTVAGAEWGAAPDFATLVAADREARRIAADLIG